MRGVGLAGVDVTGGDGVGSLLGRGRYVWVRDSHATGRGSGGDEVGGLVGRTWYSVRRSYAAVDVSGAELVGGLVGHQILNDLVSSYATGDVSGTNAVGGLVGAASDVFQTIVASYATGNVSGRGARLSESSAGLIVCDGADNSAGGGVGGLAGSSCGVIRASYPNRRRRPADGSPHRLHVQLQPPRDLLLRHPLHQEASGRILGPLGHS